MFVKATRSKGHDYLKIVESYRENGKSKRRTIVNLGRADILAESGLENIIRGLQKYLKRKIDEQNNIRDFSTERIKASLDKMEFSEIEIEGQKYFMKGSPRGIMQSIKIEDFIPQGKHN